MSFHTKVRLFQLLVAIILSLIVMMILEIMQAHGVIVR